MSIPTRLSISAETLDRAAGALVGVAVGEHRWRMAAGETGPFPLSEFALAACGALIDRTPLPEAESVEELFVLAVLYGAYHPGFEASAARAILTAPTGVGIAACKHQAAECAGIVAAAVLNGPAGVPVALRALRFSEKHAGGDSIRFALMAAYSTVTTSVGNAISADSWTSLFENIPPQTELACVLRAAIFGSFRGVSAIPLQERVRTEAFPFAPRLARAGVLIARTREPDSIGWPVVRDMAATYAEKFKLVPDIVQIPLPHTVSGQLSAGSILSLQPAIESGCDLVVSLCRVGQTQVPTSAEHVEVWLTDSEADSADPNLLFVLEDTTLLVAKRLRDGQRVHIHGVEGRSRTVALTTLVLAALGVNATDCATLVKAGLVWAEPTQRLTVAVDSLIEKLTAAAGFGDCSPAVSEVDTGMGVDESAPAI